MTKNITADNKLTAVLDVLLIPDWYTILSPRFGGNKKK
jgi:hypothetical protein